MKHLGLAPGVVALACMAGPVAASADCTCRAGGRDYALGRTECLPTSSGSRLATCEMVLNNTSWRFTATPCVRAKDHTAALDAAISPHPEAPTIEGASARH